jgi:hypothetical protein
MHIYLSNALLTMYCRQNSAVISNPAKAFVFVVQALEAETLQGKIAQHVVAAVKALVQATNTNLAEVAGSLTPEQQRTVQVYFG